MSTPDSNFSITPSNDPSSLRQSVEEIWFQLKDGASLVITEVPVDDFQSTPVIISKVFFHKLKAELYMVDAFCGKCRKIIKKLRVPSGNIKHINLLLQSVVAVLQNCDCNDFGETERGWDREGSPVLRIRPEPSGPRVRILSRNMGDPEPVLSPRFADAGLIKVKKSDTSIVITPERSDADDQERNNRLTGYTIPSILYEPAPGNVFEVIIPLNVCDALIKHCKDSNRHHREVGGILVGRKFENEHSTAAVQQNLITNIIAFRASDSSAAHLHLDENTWVHSQQIFDNTYRPQKKVILGWYHTHPTQGIFFSPQDNDVHTNFRQPHQFALVVDPKKMESGLFYWRKYDTRILGGPIIFSLERGRENIDEQTNVPRSSFEKERESISFWRICLFLPLAYAFVLYLVRDAALNKVAGGVDPNVFIFFAFTVLLGLKLWNIGFFRSRAPAELLVAKRAASSIIYGAAVAGSFVFKRPRSQIYSFAAIALLVILSFPGYWLIRNYHNLPSLLDRNPVAIVGGDTNGPPVAEPGTEKTVKLSVQQLSPNKLLLKTAEGNWPVTFNLKSNVWTPESQAAETKFFQNVFQWEITSNKKPAYLSELQSKLSTGTADGLWGSGTRTLFLTKLLSIQKEKTSLLIKLPDGQLVNILVEP